MVDYNLERCLMSSNDRIKYSQCLNLVLNAVFYLYLSLIRSRLYISNKFKTMNYRTLVSLSLSLTMNSKK